MHNPPKPHHSPDSLTKTSLPDDPDDSGTSNKKQFKEPPQDPILTKHGAAVQTNGRKVIINLPSMAAFFARDEDVACCPVTGKYYKLMRAEYWKELTKFDLAAHIVGYLHKYAMEHDLSQLLPMRTHSTVNAIANYLPVCAPLALPPLPSAHLLPVANGVLDMSGEEPVRREYRFDDYFRYKLASNWNPRAKCPRFEGELLLPGLRVNDEVKLFQRDIGRQLLPGNEAQTISLISGGAGSGKTVALSVAEALFPPNSFAYLRTSLLTGRFETHGFHGKTTLVGKDVRPDYLDNDGAAMLKVLTGADRIESEVKYGGKHSLRGNFYVIITSNSRLRIKLQGDADAWRRRLVCYDFSRESPAQRVPNFDQVLVKEEGDGILAWFVEGYMEHQRELRKHGRLVLTEAQQRRVDDLIMESEGFTAYARDHIVRGAGTITVEELWLAYTKFARERKWTIPSEQKFCTSLPDIMRELFGVERRHDITRYAKDVRGFKNVTFKDAKPEA